MKLKTTIKNKCKGNIKVVNRLVYELTKDKRTIVDAIKNNSAHGILVSPLALKAIAEELNISDTNELLVEETHKKVKA